MAKIVIKKVLGDEFSMFTETILILTAGVFGFLLGRFSVHRISERLLENETDAAQAEGIHFRKRDKKSVRQPEKYQLGSPVAGTVVRGTGEGDATVVIHPEDGRLYAPIGGKVKKIFPGGSEMLFETEFGEEMHIAVGDAHDDLLERYFRPRVVRNEVVPKGKLLLEFDGPKIAAEGGNADVFLRVEIAQGDCESVGEGRVKVGEPIVKIY